MSMICDVTNILEADPGSILSFQATACVSYNTHG